MRRVTYRRLLQQVLTHSPNHLLTHSPNHLLTHSPNHLLTHSGHEIPVIGKVLFSGGKKTKPIIIDGKLHLPPNSKWHKVKKMIRDAQVTATVASMSANLNAIKNEDPAELQGKKSPPNKSKHILALAMEAKLKSIDAVINENTMTYNRYSLTHLTT